MNDFILSESSQNSVTHQSKLGEDTLSLPGCSRSIRRVASCASQARST